MRTNENPRRSPHTNDSERRTRRPSSDRPSREKSSTYGAERSDKDSTYNKEHTNDRPHRERSGERNFSPRGNYNERSSDEPRGPRTFDKNDRPIYGDRDASNNNKRGERNSSERPSYPRRDNDQRGERRSSDRPSYPRRDNDQRGEGRNSERPSYPRRDNDQRGEGRSSERPSYPRRDNDQRGEGRSSERPSYPRRDNDQRGEGRNSERPSYPRRDNDQRGEGRSSERPSYPRRDNDQRGERRSSDRPSYPRRDNDQRGEGRSSDRPSYPRRDNDQRGEGRSSDRPSYPRRDNDQRSERRSSERSSDRPFRERSSSFRDRPSYTDRLRSSRRTNGGTNPEKHKENVSQREDGFVRLNKYIANAGICSRREADTLISSGAIKVNDQVCTALGTLIGPEDKVQFGDQSLKKEKKVYLLMNKPKEYITTSDDPQDRKTVMHLIAGACKERIYPVGRLDRNTTGVLLFTNDGEVAKKLTHPSHGARKIYHVTLDKAITKTDLKQIADGLQLDDGFIEVDEVSLITPDSKKEVGIQIHSGKNRIVRRIFEHLGYAVTKLDRVLFAELTKKELSRGQWRMLTEKEISFLRMNV